MLLLKSMMNISVVSLIFLGGAMPKTVEESSYNPSSRAQMVKDGTANVEKKLMRLVNALEECNPPDGSHNFPQMLSESDMQGESSFSTGEETSVSDPQVDEVDSHINETFDSGTTSVHFQANTPILKDNPLIIKPNFISATDETSKPVPQDPYDPTNEGSSKGGRHKGQHLHQQRGGAHLIPIIRMGETPEGNSGLTIIRPWSS